MEKLVIVGNGFDLAHGIKTQYSDFQAFLLTLEKPPRYIFRDFVEADSITDGDKAKRKFYEAITKYIPEEELWSAFEVALGDLNAEQLMEDNEDWLVGFGAENWRDSMNHDYQIMIDEELSFVREIPTQFAKWITSISTNVSPVFLAGIIHPDCVYLCFNYTDTLEKVYKIDESKITYIHGCCKNGDKLILGHHDDTQFKRQSRPIADDDSYDYYEDSEDDFRIEEASEIVRSYFKETFKNTFDIIKKSREFFDALADVSEILVIGHSMSEVDMDYFREVKKKVPNCCLWKLTYYSDEDLCHANHLIRDLSLSRYRILHISEMINK